MTASATDRGFTSLDRSTGEIGHDLGATLVAQAVRFSAV
jgi:hypothetical protein